MTTTVWAAAAGALTAAAALVSGVSVPVAVLLAIASGAAMTDSRDLRIPNALSLAAAITGVPIWLAAGAPLGALAIAGIVAAALVMLWRVELCGGGDVKYLPWLVLAVAALGTPHLAVARVLVFAVLVVGIGALWPRAARHGEGPVVVGGALALAIAIGL